MEHYKISNKGTTALFNNRFFESLTRTHFMVPIALYTISAIVIVNYTFYINMAAPWQMFYLIPLGIFSFSLVEYALHRFAFHFEAKTEKQQQVKYKIHGVHHEYPRDKDRLAMPPVISICIALVFYGIFKLLLGDLVLYFFPGFLLGYCIYLFIHYSVHRFAPPRNFLKILWTHHALHHYKDENSYFGVSLPLWDYVFGTLPESKQQKAS